MSVRWGSLDAMSSMIFGMILRPQSGGAAELRTSITANRGSGVQDFLVRSGLIESFFYENRSELDLRNDFFFQALGWKCTLKRLDGPVAEISCLQLLKCQVIRHNNRSVCRSCMYGNNSRRSSERRINQAGFSLPRMIVRGVNRMIAEYCDYHTESERVIQGLCKPGCPPCGSRAVAWWISSTLIDQTSLSSGLDWFDCSWNLAGGNPLCKCNCAT